MSRRRSLALALFSLMLALEQVQADTSKTQESFLGQGEEQEHIHTRASQQDSEVDFESPEEAPGWLADYIAFHKEHRGKPGTKYVIQACNPWCCHCGGLGDRLRGVLYALLIAKVHNRVLLVAWESPGPLEAFLRPADIDWTMNGLDVDLTRAVIMHPWNTATDIVSFEVPKDGGDELNWMVHTTHFNGRIMPPDIPPFERVSFTSHLLMKALFKPSPELELRTDQVQKEMFGSLDVPFIAVHLRMAHMDGEPGVQNRFGQTPALHALMAAWDCSQRMAKALTAEERANGAAAPTTTTTSPSSTSSSSTTSTAAASDAPASDAGSTQTPRRIRRMLLQEDDQDVLDSDHPQGFSLDQQQQQQDQEGGTAAATLEQPASVPRRHPDEEEEADGGVAAAANPADGQAEGGDQQGDLVAPWQQQQGQDQEGDADTTTSLTAAATEAAGASEAGQQPKDGEAGQRAEGGEGKGSSSTCTAERPRIAFISDHYELRHLVRKAMLGGVVGPLGDAHHIGDAKNKTNEQHFGTFVDLLLMARARCLIWADSGFPKTAIMWAWHECSRELPLCVADTFSTQLETTRRRRQLSEDHPLAAEDAW